MGAVVVEVINALIFVGVGFIVGIVAVGLRH